MEKNKKITVKINGDKSTEIKESPFPNKMAWFEQAASIEDDEREEIDLLEKSQQSLDLTALKNRKNIKRHSGGLKLFILTACAAILIAVGFGFIMLKMFVEIDKQANVPSNATTTEQVQDSNQTTTPSASNSDTKDVTLSPLKAFIVQLGVFSELGKAEEWQQNIKATGYDSVIWQVDGELRLFAGVSATQQGAKQKAELLKSEGHEVYVREWTTTKKTIQVEENVAEWLQSFPTLWSETISSDKNVDWQNWLNAAPEELSEPLVELKNETKKMSDLLANQEDQAMIQVYLLKTWKLYYELPTN